MPAKWDQNGEHAVQIVQGLIAGTIDLNDADGFIRNHRDWTIEGNPQNGYLKRNLRTNFEKTVRCWKDFEKYGEGE